MVSVSSKLKYAVAAIGMAVADVDTPALIVELDTLQANLIRMAAHARERGVRLRPHAKMHKCTTLALRQMQLGAIGVCCQKVSEAEVMVAAGIADLALEPVSIHGHASHYRHHRHHG